VRPVGGERQCTVTCPHCGAPIGGATARDTTIAFSADVLQIKTGVIQFYVDVTDPTGKPLTNAKVAITLSMPGHEHVRTVQVNGGKGGHYSAVTFLNMVGQWMADVKATSPNGETVSQAFTFNW
jgi:nitrogen fixation protein FixH